MGADAKRKESRKRKFAHLQEDEATGARVGHADVAVENNESPLKLQKHGARNETVMVEDQVNHVTANEESNDVAPTAKIPPSEKPARFICFIGNLPFTATMDTVTKHFAKVKPSAVRLGMHKGTGKSKGFAFLEFDGFDRMKTCLQSYHHSNFDDGESPPRKINVELTAGGGGAKSKVRKSRLQAKNMKLNEERRRRAEEEKTTKQPKTKADIPQDPADQSDIHPSRRNQVSAG